MADITHILERVDQGDPQATEELFPAVYGELRKLARLKMANEAPGHTLQPTALVHEAWLRLGADAQRAWKNRSYFFAAAAEAMRRILVERARSRLAIKRGSGAEPLDIDGLEIASPTADDEALLRVHEAVERFALVDARKAELVKLRYFAGMTFVEAALALGIAVPTAKQWWAYARSWLAVEMRRGPST
jgi:RNA polymerase sigma factor (TIGR02999 family)